MNIKAAVGIAVVALIFIAVHNLLINNIVADAYQFPPLISGTKTFYGKVNGNAYQFNTTYAVYSDRNITYLINGSSWPTIPTVGIIANITGDYVFNASQLNLSISVPINITGTTVNLYNYVVEVHTPSNWNGWPYVQPNGTNIYITDANNNPLYFWVEEMNVTNQSGIIWVKVPYIPANTTTTIYMHVTGGTNPYATYNNGTQVFLFFDDFNSFNVTNTWYVLAAGGAAKAAYGILTLSDPGLGSSESIISAATVPARGIELVMKARYRYIGDLWGYHIILNGSTTDYFEWMVDDFVPLDVRFKYDGLLTPVSLAANVVPAKTWLRHVITVADDNTTVFNLQDIGTYTNVTNLATQTIHIQLWIDGTQTSGDAGYLDVQYLFVANRTYGNLTTVMGNMSLIGKMLGTPLAYNWTANTVMFNLTKGIHGAFDGDVPVPAVAAPPTINATLRPMNISLISIYMPVTYKVENITFLGTGNWVPNITAINTTYVNVSALVVPPAEIQITQENVLAAVRPVVQYKNSNGFILINVTFFAEYAGNPLANLTVNVNGTSMYTNATGAVTLNLNISNTSSTVLYIYATCNTTLYLGGESLYIVYSGGTIVKPYSPLLIGNLFEVVYNTTTLTLFNSTIGVDPNESLILQSYFKYFEPNGRAVYLVKAYYNLSQQPANVTLFYGDTNTTISGEGLVAGIAPGMIINATDSFNLSAEVTPNLRSVFPVYIATSNNTQFTASIYLNNITIEANHTIVYVYTGYWGKPNVVYIDGALATQGVNWTWNATSHWLAVNLSSSVASIIMPTHQSFSVLYTSSVGYVLTFNRTIDYVSLTNTTEYPYMLVFFNFFNFTVTLYRDYVPVLSSNMTNPTSFSIPAGYEADIYIDMLNYHVTVYVYLPGTIQPGSITVINANPLLTSAPNLGLPVPSGGLLSNYGVIGSLLSTSMILALGIGFARAEKDPIVGVTIAAAIMIPVTLLIGNQTAYYISLAILVVALGYKVMRWLTS